MDIRMQRRAVTLLYRLFLRNHIGAHQIPYFPSKDEIPAEDTASLPLFAPEALGVRSSHAEGFLAALEKSRSACLHCVAASRAGQTFLLASAPAYSPSVRQTTYSVAKTVTALAVGILVSEGKLDLDTPAYRLVGEGLPPLLAPRAKSITVRHLLTMSSGVVFGEVGAVTEELWVRSFFESSVAFAPGSRFAYNSMNTYILSVIVERLTDMTLYDFVRERIFAPLEIADTLWECCPMGHTKGGWGLYLSVADCLKIGNLILFGGAYGGKQVVPREWIRLMTRKHIDTQEGLGDYNYGFHIWVARDRSAFLANGMLGQNIWIHPKNRIVAVTTAGNCELFQTGSMLNIIRDFLALPMDDAPLPPDREALLSLRAHENAFFSGRMWTHGQEPRHPRPDGTVPAELFRKLEEKPYLAEPNNFGLLPLFVMLSQNNLAGGISKLSFSSSEEGYMLTLLEGGESYRIPFGFTEYRHTTLSVRGELYRIATRAEFCDDTDGEPILKLDICFPEMASARRMRLYYATEKPTLMLSEQPGWQIMDALARFMQFVPRAKLLGNLIRSQMEKEIMGYRIRTAFAPTLQLDRNHVPDNGEFAIREAPQQGLLASLADKDDTD